MVAKLSVRLAKSTFAWMLMLLAAVEIFAQGLIPLANIAHEKQRPNQLTQEALAYKADCLRRLGYSPDVLVLGSSLPMAAIRYCDNQWMRQTEADNDALKHHLSTFQAYCRGVYLEKRLSELTNHKVSVFNFTSAACMPSDASLIFSKVLELRKKPKLMVIGFGPRDFMDNLVPEIGRTPAFNALADWPSLSGNLPNSFSTDTIRELMLESSSNCYRRRADWSLYFSELTKDLIRPTIAANAKAETKTSGGIPVAVVKDANEHICPTKARYEAWHIEDYKRRYNPPNHLRYEQELERLGHLLEAARQKDIAVVVVNMPITDTNRELIPKALFKRYQSDLAFYAEKYGATYVDLSNNDIFVAEDFLDTVHVNPVGGKKVLDELVLELSKSVKIAEVLDANGVKSIGLKKAKESAL